MISGTGGIIKQGTGTAVFTSANIYTGGTTVNGGVLALGAGGRLRQSVRSTSTV
ncbi:hypothetical protein HGG72_15550 [Ochrobactrum pecoris]|nr:hypothetical protein [Brucella pecoris]